MSAPRRIFCYDITNSVMRFTIDTRIVNIGATDGSENSLTFRIPVSNHGNNRFAIKVNDGRPDVNIVGVQSDLTVFTLTFSNAGIYNIELIGTIEQFSFNQPYGFDKRKIIYCEIQGNKIGFFLRAFYQCVNLTFNVKYPIKMKPQNYGGLFQEIYKLEGDISLIDISEATGLDAMLRDINQPLPTALNAFFNGISNFNQIYYNARLTLTPKVEVISNSITNVSQAFTNSMFRGELIFSTPNVTSYDRLLYGYTDPPHCGKVDIRKATNANLIQFPWSNTNTDATLLGWVNNFDWTSISSSHRVTIDCKGSKYSNDLAVLSAKSFLESKGIAFTNLTMA